MTGSSEARSGTATVLFTDLVGSTSHRLELGEDAADEFRRDHERLLRDAVGDNGGVVIKGTGDGVMATFSSASDAVAAAVAIQQADLESAPDGVGDRIRIGLSAGDLTWEADDCFGTPVVEAARLCAHAEGGHIMVADVVRVLARGRRGHAFESAGSIDLKGFPDPLDVYEVSWAPRPLVTRGVLPAALVTTSAFAFVGRASDRTRASALVGEAERGRAHLLLVSGEPGIGKTRLAAEIAATASTEGALVLYGRCDEDIGLPYQPFVEALQHVVDTEAPADLRRLIGRYGGELVRLCPDLAAALPGLPPPLESDAEVQRYRLFDAVASWLMAMSEAKPVVFVMDDLHWAAQPTLLLLRHTLQRNLSSRVLVVGTYRDTDLGRTHPLSEMLGDLRRDVRVERLALSGLEQADVLELLGPSTAELIATAVHAETEGNPFFVAEVVQHMQEQGSIVRDGDGWTATRPLSELGIPEGIRDVVGRRVSRLSADANDVLAVGAAIGLDFDLATTLAIEERDADTVLAALDESVSCRLLDEVDVGRYQFVHALVRSTIYDELSLTKRVQLHRRIGVAIESVDPDNVLALAHHFSLAAAAGETSRAVRYGLAAALEALDHLAVEQARDLIIVAAELLDELDDDALRCDVLLTFGKIERLLGQGSHRELLLEAAHIAQRLGDVDRLTEAAAANGGGVGDVPGVDEERVEVFEAALAAMGDVVTAGRARVLAALLHELVSSNDARRFEVADLALDIARRVGDPATLAFVLHGRCDHLNSPPHTLASRLTESAEALALAEGLGDPVAIALVESDRASALAATGDVAGLFATYERISSIGDEYNLSVFQRQAALVRSAEALCRGRLAEAEGLADEALVLMQQTGHRSSAAFHAGLLFAIRYEQGRVAGFEPVLAPLVDAGAASEAVQAGLGLVYRELERPRDAAMVIAHLAADRFRRVLLDGFWLQTMCHFAEVAAWLDDREIIDELYEQLHPFAGQTVFALTVNGRAGRYVGMLAAARNSFEEADELFRDAVAADSGAGVVLGATRGRLAWAEMLTARGKPGDLERACELTDLVIASAAEIGMALVERRARALWQRLGR